MADLIERDAAYDAIGFERCNRSCTDCPTKCTWFYTVKNIPAVNRWISCSEMLPEQSEEGQPPNVKCSDCVLVAAGNWIGMAYYVTYGEESQWEFADAQNKPKIDWTEVTHWMSIPEPPEKE